MTESRPHKRASGLYVPRLKLGVTLDSCVRPDDVDQVIGEIEAWLTQLLEPDYASDVQIDVEERSDA